MQVKYFSPAFTTELNTFAFSFKDYDHSMRVEELQGEVTHRERHITNLRAEVTQLQNSIDQMTRDLEMRANEIQKIKMDATIQIR